MEARRTVHVPLPFPLWRRLEMEAERENRTRSAQAAVILADHLRPLAGDNAPDAPESSPGRPFLDGPIGSFVLLLEATAATAGELLLRARGLGASDATLAAVDPGAVATVSRIVTEGRRPVGNELFDLADSNGVGTRPNGCRVYHYTGPQRR